ncbi:MAG: acyl--CoA ligase [Clostridia bacterium]|nr:acyl--CoA ligase [Clostridia bacterium]
MMMEDSTGYPSVDKPQNKYYRDKPARIIETNQSIYDLVFNTNRNNLDDPAIEYLGHEYTYRALKKEVDSLAKAFLLSGCETGDTVLLGLTNTPEAVIASLAINRIGCIQRWFDVRVNEKILSEYIINSKSKCLIAMDFLLPVIRGIIETTGIKSVLIVHPSSCMHSAMKALYSIKHRKETQAYKYHDDRIHEFWDYLKTGHYAGVSLPQLPFDKARPSVMVQSSGTTGKPKIIVHSDFSATSSVYSFSHSDLPVEKGKVLLNLLPPWIAYGLGHAIIYPLAMGCKVLLSPTFEPDAIMPYIGKFTFAFGAPFHYRYLCEHFDQISSRKKAKFFARVDALVSGGDKVTIQENQKFEEVFKTKFGNGYGNNEGWGCLTVNPILHNKYGSIGIPKYGETVICYDSKTKKELPYGEIGEICVQANTAFLYYDQDQNEAETRKVKVLHSDGKEWIHTGDLGSIDSDGFVFLSGRVRRVIIRQGFKISAYTIEDKICEMPEIKECVAVEAPDAIEEHVPAVFVTVAENDNPDQEAIKKLINKKCETELKTYEIPKHIVFLEKMPYTANGKYDFRWLEQKAIDLFQPQSTK